MACQQRSLHDLGNHQKSKISNKTQNNPQRYHEPQRCLNRCELLRCHMGLQSWRKTTRFHLINNKYPSPYQESYQKQSAYLHRWRYQNRQRHLQMPSPWSRLRLCRQTSPVQYDIRFIRSSKVNKNLIRLIKKMYGISRLSFPSINNIINHNTITISLIIYQ